MQIQKKDGRMEPFDRNKVLGGVIKSGATPEQAESIATQIEAWAQTAAIGGVIRSSEVRIKVLELLRLVNLEAAANFETYQKPA